jgi:hypothetical protein
VGFRPAGSGFGVGIRVGVGVRVGVGISTEIVGPQRVGLAAGGGLQQDGS